jgi:mTERF
VEKNCRPNVEKLMEIGFSVNDMSALVSRYPRVFVSDIKPKMDFWMRALGSTEQVSMVVKGQPILLCISLEKVLIPNLSFFQEQLHLSACQIIRLIRLAPFLIKSSPEAVSKLKRLKNLGSDAHHECSCRHYLL